MALLLFGQNKETSNQYNLWLNSLIIIVMNLINKLLLKMNQ